MALSIEELQAMQRALQDRYAGWWEPVDPDHGKNKMLWLLAEMGEAIQVVKRHQADEIMQAGEVRHELVEELADVMMFFNDILLCYGITPDEFEEVYRAKHTHNLNRWHKPSR